MAAINDLIAQIEDEGLRLRIEAEVKRLLEHKKFGLVFEDHLPEGLTEEPVYPCLQMIDQVAHAEDQSLWHTLIEADNYYALQLLAYLYPGKVDCIYIDPPYNTGARDWKYNNDYVDSSDHYRHSKWLSMMKRRLALAKKLLNPKDSVLIVTIDEKEYLHLGCLLEEMFPEARMQMVSSVINNGGVRRGAEFSRTDEYLFFLMFGKCVPQSLPLSEEWYGNVKNTNRNKLRWREFKRSGSHNLRSDRPNQFYPIFVHKDGKSVHSVGTTYLGNNYRQVEAPENTIAIWPIFPDGREGCWVYQSEGFKKLLAKGYIRLGRFTDVGMSISYLAEGEQKKVEQGDYKIIGYGADGSVITDGEGYEAKIIPGTNWQIGTHNASEFGTKIINSIIGSARFSYPKSLYAVHDAIRFFVADKPDALIVDFFAGSGTTLHAVNLLNAADGGRRRCIMVTNNEVSDSEAKALRKQGLQPGDAEWERLGIARYVCWPRTVCSIEGHDVNGEPLRGEYLGTDHRAMKDGFEANCIFFRLAFLDKAQVALGRQFRELLPLLWMKAGAIGPCPTLAEGPDVPPMLILPGNAFAVLTDARRFSEFVSMVECEDAIRMVYLVVDSDSMYRDMSRHFPKRQTCQLYRDYLDNFRINQTR